MKNPSPIFFKRKTLRGGNQGAILQGDKGDNPEGKGKLFRGKGGGNRATPCSKRGIMEDAYIGKKATNVDIRGGSGLSFAGRREKASPNKELMEGKKRPLRKKRRISKRTVRAGVEKSEGKKQNANLS